MKRDFGVIFSVFAGREEYLSILHYYIIQCLDLNYIDEYHIMNFTRNMKDYEYVMKSYDILKVKYPNRIFIHCNEITKERIQKKVKNPPMWPYYYESLGKTIPDQQMKEYVMIKCDDDILFFDIHQFHLATFQRYFNKQPFLMHANCINNGVCSYFQRESFPKIKDKLTYPKGGICGPIFQTPQLGYIMQYDFLKSILQDPTHLSNFHLTKNEFVTTRISINFCFFHSEDISFLNSVSIQDEYDVSSRIPEDLLRPTLILSNFISCHHSYTLQERIFKSLPSLLPLYKQLTLIQFPISTFQSISLSTLSFYQKDNLYEINGEEGYEVKIEDGRYLGVQDGKFILTNQRTELFEWNGNELCYQIYPITRYNTGENEIKNEMLYSKCLVDVKEKEMEYKDGYMKLMKWNEYMNEKDGLVYFSKEKNRKWFIEKIDGKKESEWVKREKIDGKKESEWVKREKKDGKWIYQNVQNGKEYKNEYAGWRMERFKYDILVEKIEI
jgi:hypothetical protein